MKAPRRIISHPGELDALSVLPIKRTPGRRRVMIADHLIVSQQEREALEGELNRRLFACGCTAATAGLLLALFGYAAWALIVAPDIGFLGHAGRCLLAMIMGSMIGKLAGLAAAERRLKHTIAEVKRAIPAGALVRPKPLPEEIACY